MQKNLFNIDFNDLWKRLINLATLKKQSWILQWNVNQISDGLLSPLTNRCRHSDMLKAAFVNVHRNFLDLQKELQNWPSFTALSQICYEPVKNNFMDGVVAQGKVQVQGQRSGQNHSFSIACSTWAEEFVYHLPCWATDRILQLMYTMQYWMNVFELCEFVSNEFDLLVVCQGGCWRTHVLTYQKLDSYNVACENMHGNTIAI